MKAQDQADSKAKTVLWDQPRSRDCSALGSPDLYAEVLQFARAERSVSESKLKSQEDGLRQRLRGLLLVENPTTTAIRGALSVLQAFGWLAESAHGQYVLTADGDRIVSTLARDKKRFRRELAVRMQCRYVVPGWLVARLWALNREGQGEVVLPSPPRRWSPASQQRDRCEWTKELADRTVESAEQARAAIEGSFPITNDTWLDAVRQEWDRLGTGTCSPAASRREESVRHTFAPRGRLAQAMREAAVKLLFDRAYPAGAMPDFPGSMLPVPPRSFKAWSQLQKSAAPG